ncbi:SDR family oxidoreductase [Aquabacterium sp. CECT 9606]|uniref:SDR family oxidoreductase n=1 Tax=Aquabacterium sp. CECT 9606 TaxID=2845822 RepID=UPI001E3FE96E|nr:SDR family oxidoreductase [Aquabacterium sp. CECT 9606]CAH0350765.1 Gluconate 5-dehydrogenase [Aquabacterium sp. CECT 9606]
MTPPAPTPPHPFRLDGRLALVTGSARGLGLSMARALAQAGAQVLVNGRHADAVHAAVQDIITEGGQAHPAVFDIGHAEAVARAMDELRQRHGALHILVNNVGQRDRRPLDDFALDEVRRLLEVNLVAPLELARQAARLMPVGQGTAAGGRIINITSIAGPISRAGDVAYTTAKGGLDALTRALAAELGPRGITVNAVAPGYFATEANREMVADAAVAHWLGQRTSLGRWGDPGEIAGAVVFLASGAASYITGQTLAVDGGYLAHF